MVSMCVGGRHACPLQSFEKFYFLNDFLLKENKEIWFERLIFLKSR